jgi:hypothetical protein
LEVNILRNLLLPLLLSIAMITIGCETFTPATPQQQAPTAYIDSISPSEVIAGDSITFIGHGTDAASTIVAHRWRSSVDGNLSS